MSREIGPTRPNALFPELAEVSWTTWTAKDELGWLVELASRVSAAAQNAVGNRLLGRKFPEGLGPLKS